MVKCHRFKWNCRQRVYNYGLVLMDPMGGYRIPPDCYHAAIADSLSRDIKLSSLNAALLSCRGQVATKLGRGVISQPRVVAQAASASAYILNAFPPARRRLWPTFTAAKHRKSLCMCVQRENLLRHLPMPRLQIANASWNKASTDGIEKEAPPISLYDFNAVCFIYLWGTSKVRWVCLAVDLKFKSRSGFRQKACWAKKVNLRHLLQVQDLENLFINSD